MIKCEKIIPIRKEFAKELMQEYIGHKLENANAELILSFVEDIIRYLENENEKCKTN